MPKYIIADPDVGPGWTHIFLEAAVGSGDRVEVERLCRFVLDRERLELVHVDIERDHEMVTATTGAAKDLFDSLIHGNPSLVDDPESFSLAIGDHLPEWCRNDDAPSPNAKKPQADLFAASRPMNDLMPMPAPTRHLSIDAPSPKTGTEWSRELVESIAKDVGDAIAAHIEIMYPAAVAAASSTFLLSVKNSIRNEIMAAISVSDATRIAARLADRKRARRKLKSAYRKMRAADVEVQVYATSEQENE